MLKQSHFTSAAQCPFIALLGLFYEFVFHLTGQILQLLKFIVFVAHFYLPYIRVGRNLYWLIFPVQIETDVFVELAAEVLHTFHVFQLDPVAVAQVVLQAFVVG